jgi:hypothetical protein
MVPGEIGNSKDRRNKEAQIRFRARTWLSGKIASGIAVQAIVVDGLGRDRWWRLWEGELRAGISGLREVCSERWAKDDEIQAS